MADQRRLVVMRHAKSSWKTNDPDESRPLSPRGTRDAVVAGHVLAPLDISFVWCSPALRAQQTLQCLQLGGVTPKRSKSAGVLYGGTAEQVLAVLQGTPDDVASALIVGHEPWASDLLGRLAAPSPLLDDALAKFPTGAIGVLRFTGSWADLGRGSATLTAFEVPRG